MNARSLDLCAPPWVSGRPVPESGQVSIVSLTALRTAPGTARQWARRVLDEFQVVGEGADTAVLLLSELVTNTVKFGRPPYGVVPDDIGMALWFHDGCVVVEITDGSMSLPFLKNANSESESGRGLRLVDGLSERWGYYVPGRGRKTVYCVVRAGGREKTGAGG